MVKVLVSGSTGPGLSPDQEQIFLCFWARHLTLAVPLSTQVYTWVLANLMLGVTHSGRSRNTPSRFMPYKPDLSTGLMGNLAQMQT